MLQNFFRCLSDFVREQTVGGKKDYGRSVLFVKYSCYIDKIVPQEYLASRERKPEEAVDRYLAMTKPDQPLQSQLRGHWMLAGIYAGDWGNAGQPIVDVEKSRRHLTEILANWPDSPEAKLLKEWLRWDDKQEQTEFNYLPRLNASF